jgi:hypothetical protein
MVSAAQLPAVIVGVSGSARNWTYTVQAGPTKPHTISGTFQFTSTHPAQEFNVGDGITLTITRAGQTVTPLTE